MNRRRLLVALGGLAGTGGVLGTGAFTSVNANRSVSVAVANDSSALLGLGPCDGANGAYVTGAGSGVMTLDISPSNPDVAGEGVNGEATTVVHDVFEVRNQGTQPVGVWLDVDPVEDGSGTDRVQFYVDGDRSTEVVGKQNARCLGVGDSVCVGLAVETTGVAPGDYANLLRDVANGHEMVVHADADAGAGCGSTAPEVGGIVGPTDGLGHYWPLDDVGDGTAADVVGGSDGAVTGATAAAGRVGGSQGASFDGTDDRIDPSPDPGIASGFTVTVWLRGQQFDHVDFPLAVSKWQRLQNRDFVLGYHTDEGTLYAQFNREPDGNKTTLYGPPPATDTWYFCAFTYDGTTGRFYVDGTEVASKSGAFDVTSSDVVIGAKDDGGNYWDGTLDDVRIYDRVLSASEIQTLYTSS
jgi:hypothetical protein